MLKAQSEGLAPRFQAFDEVVEYFRHDVPEIIHRRFQGRIDRVDAHRFTTRLDEFPALRTVVRADLHFMFIRVGQGKVPSRDKTSDYRHAIDAAYCSGILIDDRKLLRKVPLLNAGLRALPWPADESASRAARSVSPEAKPSHSRRSAEVARARADRYGGSGRECGRERTEAEADCIYCRSTIPPKKREHVISQALGTFEQNWTLDCVCDECNKYFADTLELALGRDSREALLRLDLGLKQASGASELLNQRVRASLQDPGLFDGIRLLMAPSDDGRSVIPIPVPQVGFRIPGQDWCFLTERDLTAANLQRFSGPQPVEIRIHGIGADCERLRARLHYLGVEFAETHRLLDQPITEQQSISVLFEIDNDETVVRAACKIGFNYAAKLLGARAIRDPRFDAARRFVRFGEAPVRIATAQRRSILVGPDAGSARIHACGLGWHAGYLCVVVSLFNELLYGLRLCEAEPNEFSSAQHLFDPWARTISEAGVAS